MFFSTTIPSRALNTITDNKITFPFDFTSGRNVMYQISIPVISTVPTFNTLPNTTYVPQVGGSGQQMVINEGLLNMPNNSSVWTINRVLNMWQYVLSTTGTTVRNGIFITGNLDIQLTLDTNNNVIQLTPLSATGDFDVLFRTGRQVPVQILFYTWQPTLPN